MSEAVNEPWPAPEDSVGVLWDRAWRGAADSDLGGLEWLQGEPMDAGFLSPRWWCPIADVRAFAQGGVYGVTALGGDAGSGKSMFAACCALKAALEGELALYIAAEMTRQQILSRFAWLGAQWGYSKERIDQALSERLIILYRRGALTLEELNRWMWSGLAGNQNALLVVDSWNSLLGSFAEDGLGYWTRFARLLEVILQTRKQSEGRFAALLISELNKDSVSKGRQLEYASDLMLSLRETQTPRVVKVRIVKNRERGGSGPLGQWRMTDEGTYVRVEQ